MFVAQGIKPENEFWKYIVGSIAIILASLVGQLPLVMAIFYQIFFHNKTYPTSNESAMRFFSSNTMLFLLFLSFIFVMIGIAMVVRKLHNQTMLSVTTSRKTVDWKRVAFAFIIWSVVTIMATMISYFYNPSDFIINFKPIPFAILVVIGVILIPIQTSAEEYVFRGYLMQGFANLARNKWFPLLMTSVIFGAMHIFNPEVNKIGYIILVYYIGTGLLLGIITLMDEGMELALGFHAANNLVGALLVTSDWSAFQTNSIFKDVSDPSAGLDVILPVVIIYPILLFIFSKKYSWTGWKEKLTGTV